MKLFLARRGKGWVPTDDEGLAVLNRMGQGEVAMFEIVRPRSVQWNKLYHAICSEIGRNQDPERDEQSIDYELRIRAGHFEVMFVDGKEIRVAKRIAFSHMSHDEWVRLWPSIDLAIRERFGEEFAPQPLELPNG